METALVLQHRFRSKVGIVTRTAGSLGDPSMELHDFKYVSTRNA